jgi:integrase
MPRIKLTQHTIDKRLRAPHPSGRPTIFWDEELRGFGVLCSGVTSARTFVVQRDLPGGKTRRVTVASVAEMKLEKAREEARGLLVDMRRGIDPKRQRAGSRTLRETLDAYLAKNRGLAPRSVEIYRHLVLHHLEPWLDRALSSITPGDVDDMHDKIAQTVAKRTNGVHSGATVANDAMRAFRLLYNWAASRDDAMPRNPLRLRKDEWHEQDPVRRPIPAERLADFYAAATKLPPIGRDWLLLMLYTGMRRREAASLRWSENIDFDKRAIRLPAASVKGKRALDLPMSDFAHELLVARRALGNANFVFPSYGESGHVEDPRAFIDAVRAATGIEFSSHDLRRTFITVAESCDISAFALKALVNHGLGAGVTEGYIRMTVDRLREPAQRVADRLKQLCGIKEPEGVTKLGRAPRRK